MSQDKIADVLSIIKNGQSSHLKSVKVRKSKFVKAILEVLCAEGYLHSFQDVDNSFYEIDLAYADGEPVIRDAERVSKPSRRIYCSARQIPRNKGGLGIYLLSTSIGVLPSYEAKKKNIGGELICKIY